MAREDCLCISYDESDNDIPIIVIARFKGGSDEETPYEIVRSAVGSKAKELYESLIEDDD